MKFEAVLFDLDGTLLDTIQDLTDSMNQALESLGFPTHNYEDCKMFVGDGVEMFALRALPENHRDDFTVVKCVHAMRQVYSERWAQKTRPYDGIPELLDNLTLHQIRMAILSNKPHDSTQEMVTELLSKWRFNPVAGARPSVPKKPDPTAALQIAQQLKVDPKNFLYLGDTATDMKTARESGMFAVGALWGFRGAEELREAGAQMILEHPMELLKIL